MSIICPRCQSAKIKKNGKTHYGKQNHRCKSCGRQFVQDNRHTIGGAIKGLVEQALKERLSLRAICRIFGLSLTWLQAYARALWGAVPADLGLSEATLGRIKRLQVFGIQADELWSFVGKKTKKRWIWVAYDPVHRLVVAHFIGGRGKKAAKKFWERIPPELRDCHFETDDWDAYKGIIPKQRHKVGKELTYYIEGFNATIRARVSRLVRKTLSFSKNDKWHQLAVAWFFWQFNLERQHYI
jgi:insertion element IS1 protein InsB